MQQLLEWCKYIFGDEHDSEKGPSALDLSRELPWQQAKYSYGLPDRLTTVNAGAWLQAIRAGSQQRTATNQYPLPFSRLACSAGAN